MNVLLIFGTVIPTIVFTATLLTYRIPITKQVKAGLGYPKDNLLNFTELATKNGYGTETHKITTPDGYISLLFRMYDLKCVLRTPPLVLVHGVLQSADSWLDAGRNSLAFLLADSCYDLWFANTRGTYYSRAHRFLNPDVDAQFWNYSIDEVGYYDIPTIIDSVLNRTSAQKVNYIGYSQEGAALLITLETYPEYNDKVNLNIGLAPAVQLKNMKSPFRLLFKVVADNETFLRRIGFLELLFKGSLTQVFQEYVCLLPFVATRLYCLATIAAMDGYNPRSISKRTLRRMFAHIPAGVSVQTLVKYHQTVVKGGFPKYDYGPSINLQRYGSVEAPNFELTKAIVPTVLFTGLNDHLIVTKDIVWLSKRLPNVLALVIVNSSFWDHYDIGYSRYVLTLLFPKVNEYLLKYSEESNNVL